MLVIAVATICFVLGFVLGVPIGFALAALAYSGQAVTELHEDLSAR